MLTFKIKRVEQLPLWPEKYSAEAIAQLKTMESEDFKREYMCEPIPVEKPQSIPHKDFVLAGAAVFTLRDPENDTHFTFRVNKSKDDRATSRSYGSGVPTWFVNLGIGYDSSIYMGLLKGDAKKLVLTKGSRVGLDAPSYGMFVRWWEAVANDHESSIQMDHEGKCCACARPLTHPISIALGIGPECGGHYYDPQVLKAMKRRTKPNATS